MNSTAIIVMLVSILGTATATLLIPWLVKQSKARIAAQQDFATAMKGMTNVVTVLADVPKMIAGHAAAAGAMAAEVGKLREVVTEFGKLIMRNPVEPSPKESFVSVADEGEAEKQYTVARMWAENPDANSEIINQMAEEELAKRAGLPSVSME